MAGSIKPQYCIIELLFYPYDICRWYETNICLGGERIYKSGGWSSSLWKLFECRFRLRRTRKYPTFWFWGHTKIPENTVNNCFWYSRKPNNHINSAFDTLLNPNLMLYSTRYASVDSGHEDDMDDDTCHEEFPDVCLFSVAMMMMDKVIT